jgi:hypothetical protein
LVSIIIDNQKNCFSVHGTRRVSGSKRGVNGGQMRG